MSARSARVRRAHRLLRRAGRERDGRFLVEGPQAVREALAVGVAVELFVTARAEERQAELIASADRAGVLIRPVADDALVALAETVAPQGVVAACRLLGAPLDGVLTLRPRLVVVLAEVRDPGNAGTVVRCADAAGADAVVASAGSVDLHNGKAVRASAGSVFHLPLVLDVDLPGALERLRIAGLRVLVADAAAPLDLEDAADRGLLSGPVAWVFGNEARGVPAAVVAGADAAVCVPIHGRAESLNLATAAAVCLYATARANRPA